VLPTQKRNSIDLQQIKTSLHNAWGTEFILLTSKRFVSEDELIRLSNNWNCIQTYYIFYHCTQALAVAKGQSRPESHPRTQNLFYNFWASRPVCLPPWTLSYKDNCLSNIPDGININTSVHDWSVCRDENIWNLVGKALMTTRKEVLKEREKETRQRKKSQAKKIWEEKEALWLAKKKKPRPKPKFPLPLLNQAEKQQINSQLRPYTIMDYLFRLRIKTNYVDSNMFTDGPEDDNQSLSVREFLYLIASETLFLHELTISKIIGTDKFNKWALDWIKRNVPADMNAGLIARQKYFK